MVSNWRLTMLGGGVGLHLVGLAFFLSGIVSDQVRFEEARAGALGRYEAAPQRGVALSRPGTDTRGRTEAGNPPWAVHIGRVDEALAQRNLLAAKQAWLEAYLAALRSPHWAGMVEVGDASLRIGEAEGTRTASRGTARRTYLSALIRSQQQRSLEGVLRVGEAFAALGDREVANQSIAIAERLTVTPRDPKTRQRLDTFRKRVATLLLTAGRSGQSGTGTQRVGARGMRGGGSGSGN